jgi:ABC-type sulfate/molybdate transport systems ATPase subunit
MVGCAVTCFLFPLCKDFPSLMTFFGFFGFFVGMSDLYMNINNLQLFTTIFLTSSKYTLLQLSCHNYVIKDGKSLHNGNRKQVTAHPTIPTVHKLIADILVLSTIIPGNSLPIVFKTPKLSKYTNIPG